jgi:Cu-processing system permease protein
MKKIIKYVILDILRNRIMIGYTLFLLVISLSVFNLEGNPTKGILSLLNIVLIIVPLISIIFSTIYVYNAAEFIELLVSQPVKRKNLWMSIFSGLAVSLCTAFLVGCGLPLMLYVPDSTGIILLVMGLFITVIFTAIALLASMFTRDKAKGIGISILLWFYFTLIFDGIILFLLFQFMDYPMEKPMIAFSFLNPVDLARILILLQLDISALMGATSALFQDFFGSSQGMIIALLILLLWIAAPLWFSLRRFAKKDL